MSQVGFKEVKWVQTQENIILTQKMGQYAQANEVLINFN
jgi:hypothetical protein